MTDVSETREELHPIKRLWREVGLPEYFLGNGGSNTKLYALYDAIRASAQPMTETKGKPDDWRDDPSADERWQAGCDFAMLQLCSSMGVDPKSVRWDAATETLDGDVTAVIWNILRAKMGEDWDPHDAAALRAQPRTEEVREKKSGFAFPEIKIDWNQINGQQFQNSRTALMAKLARFMAPESKASAYWSNNYFNRSEMYVLHELLKAAQPTEAPAGEVREALEHARARFQCLAEDFYETRYKTADWAMCCADAELMERVLAAVAPERGEK